MTSLTKTAVDLLLQAMETRAGKVQVATLRQVAPRAADKLLEARLLVATGRIPVVAAMDAYEDEPIPAEWCPERGQYGYRDSVGRWITVEAAEIDACAVDYPLAFARMLVAFERGASLIVAVGTHSSMVDFLDKGRAGMASTFLVRMKVGPILVDAKGVNRLYDSRVRKRDLLLLVVAAAFTLAIISYVSEPIRLVVRGLLLSVR